MTDEEDAEPARTGCQTVIVILLLVAMGYGLMLSIRWLGGVGGWDPGL